MISALEGKSIADQNDTACTTCAESSDRLCLRCESTEAGDCVEVSAPVAGIGSIGAEVNSWGTATAGAQQHHLDPELRHRERSRPAGQAVARWAAAHAHQWRSMHTGIRA